MNIWHDVDPSRVLPNNFVACIEISKGSKNKYELDKATGGLILDRILYTATHYPHNYGLIPLTYAGDFDPLDVLVLCTEPIVPLALVQCYPIGVIEMIDGGLIDEKIIAVCTHDPFYSNYQDISELPEHVANEIVHFFQVYKTLEGKNTIVHQAEGRARAVQIIANARKAYDLKFGNEKEKK